MGFSEKTNPFAMSFSAKSSMKCVVMRTSSLSVLCVVGPYLAPCVRVAEFFDTLFAEGQGACCQ